MSKRPLDTQKPDGFVGRADRFVAVREGWEKRPGEAGAPYRAKREPGSVNTWIVTDRTGRNCWVRDTGQISDSRRDVAEAVAAAWNDEANETQRGRRDEPR